jgi:hypothetical protein
VTSWKETSKETPTTMRTRDADHPECNGMRPESKTMTGKSEDPFSINVKWKTITYISSQLNG